MSGEDIKRVAQLGTTLDLQGVNGLREDEAHLRLEAEGPNDLPSEKPRSMPAIALQVAREPMFLMLVAAGSLYLFMGEPADAAMLLGFVFVVMAITIIQERRTERALDALRDLSSPRALVIRDGLHRRIPGREVVLGDLDEQLFSMKTISVALLQGLSVLAVCLGIFLLSRTDHSPEAARALAFATLVVAFVVIILVNRSWTKSALVMLRVPNIALRWVVLGTCILLTVVLLVPFAQRLFHFAPLHPKDLVLSLGAGLVCVLWFELLKLRKRPAREPRS